MRALVLGGYGAVGTHVVAGLRDRGDVAIAAGRDRSRADLVVDVAGGPNAAYEAALGGVDVVVNASGAEDPDLVATAAARDVAFVDITASTAYVEELERLRPAAPVLLSVGLAPGLTTLLAAAAHADCPGPVDVAIVLGAGERHGAAGVDWTFRLFGRRFADTRGGRPVRNVSRPRRFDLPLAGRRLLYRADFSDQHTLTRDLGVPVRTYFGLDTRLATAALAALARIPGAAHAPRGLHVPGSERWLVAARARDGRLRWAHGRTQSRATAVMTVFAARTAGSLPAGVRHIHDVARLADVPEQQGIVVDAGCVTPPRP